MSILSDLLSALSEGATAQKYGPDFAQRIQIQRAKAMQDQAESAARLKESGLDIESKGLGLEETRSQIARKRKVEEELARRAGAGELPSEFPEVAEALSGAGKEKRAGSAEERAAAEASRQAELFPAEKAQAEATLSNTKNQFVQQLALARERAANVGTMQFTPAMNVETGAMEFAPKRALGSGQYAPTPTAEMRNQQYQAQAMEPAFELVEQSLNSLEATGAGIKAVIPGTDAYYAKTRFVDQAKALLGAIVARQAGEGSRLSDEDRRAYSQAATLVNNTILLPGGIQEARARIADARNLLNTIQARRSGVRHPGPSPAPSSGLRVLSIEEVQ